MKKAGKLLPKKEGYLDKKVENSRRMFNARNLTREGGAAGGGPYQKINKNTPGGSCHLCRPHLAISAAEQVIGRCRILVSKCMRSRRLASGPDPPLLIIPPQCLASYQHMLRSLLNSIDSSAETHEAAASSLRELLRRLQRHPQADRPPHLHWRAHCSVCRPGGRPGGPGLIWSCVALLAAAGSGELCGLALPQCVKDLILARVLCASLVAVQALEQIFPEKME